MDICGEKFRIQDTFDTPITVPDCIVLSDNKLGKGHGEAKFYVTIKDKMRGFYGGEGFHTQSFLLYKDPLSPLDAMTN